MTTPPPCAGAFDMAKLHQYPPALRALLAAPPRQGEGHRWFYRVALLVRRHHPADLCFQLLRACADRFGDRIVPSDEIWKSINKAYAATRPDTAAAPTWKWPEPSQDAIEKVLTTTAPLPLDPLPIDAGRALPALFSHGELICMGMTQSDGGTYSLAEAQGLAPWHHQFVVPSPMTSRDGRTQTGTPAWRSLANTGARRYLIVENDNGTHDQQARILKYLDNLTPSIRLTIVVDSAGKSLHGWFDVRAIPEPCTRAFFSVAVLLGADPHTWAACQWVRMPGGTRYRPDAEPRKQEIMWARDDFQQQVLGIL
ncbi:MAG: hypothetical protein NTV22_04930 [bacterium]|nr:hypothetical protein [bacterium]